MTPEKLRKLADEQVSEVGIVHSLGSDNLLPLYELAPDLARLCAELGEIVQYVRDGMCGHISGECINRTDAALAKLSELNNGAKASPTPETF